MSGLLLLHLHAHLPDVRPAESGGVDFEDWFFESLCGCYLPLVRILERWAKDGVSARISLSVSSPLASMLEDEPLLGRARARWRALRGLLEELELPDAQKEILAEPLDLALDEPRLALVPRLRALQEQGVVDLWATGASHGFLPFLELMAPDAAWAQVAIGRRRHRLRFGAPRGFWIPECGLTPATSGLLARAQLPCAFTEFDGAGRYGPASPVASVRGPVFFPRDPSCARDVWHPEFGYPSASEHREFHADLGPSLDRALLERHGLPADGRPLNLKPFRVGPDAPRTWYLPIAARQRAEQQAAAFVDARTETVRACRGRTPVLSAPYDAELFGHWWHEGPIFLDALARHPRPELEMVTAADVLRAQPELEVTEPRPGSWGEHGWARTWLGGDNAWIQDQIARWAPVLRRRAREDFAAALRSVGHFLGLCASDWPFLVRGGSYVDAVTERIASHVRALRTPVGPLHSGLRADSDDVMAFLGEG